MSWPAEGGDSWVSRSFAFDILGLDVFLLWQVAIHTPGPSRPSLSGKFYS